jgi:hypothetical protein
MADREDRVYVPRAPRVWSGLSPLELAARMREIMTSGRIPPRYLIWEAINIIERGSEEPE